MKRIFNGLFYGLKFLLLIGAFGLTLFILIRMNIRLANSNDIEKINAIINDLNNVKKFCKFESDILNKEMYIM